MKISIFQKRWNKTCAVYNTTLLVLRDQRLGGVSPVRPRHRRCCCYTSYNLTISRRRRGRIRNERRGGEVLLFLSLRVQRRSFSYRWVCVIFKLSTWIYVGKKKKKTHSIKSNSYERVCHSGITALNCTFPSCTVVSSRIFCILNNGFL